MNKSIFLKEVMEQPEAMRRLLSLKSELLRVFKNFKGRGEILMLGMGASYYAAEFAALSLNFRGIPARAMPLSQALMLGKDFIERFYPILLISQSGRTIELIRLLEKFEKLKDRFFLITNDPESDGALLVNKNQVIPIEAGIEEAMGSSKTFMNTIMVLSIMIESIVEEDWDLHRVVDSVERALSTDIDDLSWRVESSGRSVFVSWAEGVPIYGMGSLTMIEVAKLSSIAIEGGMFRHGTMEIMASSPALFLFPIRKNPIMRKFESLLEDIEGFGFQPAVVIPNEDCIYPACFLSGLAVLQRVAEKVAKRKGLIPGTGIFASKVTRKE
ncbi:MAG: SIS domain-containing protein [Thermotogaceae bacterium]|nr:SIS domain-containing protein [Thermotogaceae bacterium]